MMHPICTKILPTTRNEFNIFGVSGKLSVVVGAFTIAIRKKEYMGTAFCCAHIAYNIRTTAQHRKQVQVVAVQQVYLTAVVFSVSFPVSLQDFGYTML